MISRNGYPVKREDGTGDPFGFLHMFLKKGERMSFAAAPRAARMGCV